jgi:hypothetical protein
VKSSNSILLARLRSVSRSLKEFWRLVIYFCSTELFWRSGVGFMFMRERHYGRWLWILNMVACGVDGVLIRFQNYILA